MGKFRMRRMAAGLTVLVMLLSAGRPGDAVRAADGDFKHDGAVLTDYTGSDADVLIPEVIDGVAITEIGEAAFQWKDGLQSIVIPGTIARIGDFAFCYSDALKRMTFKGPNVPEMGNTPFDGLSDVVVVCPAEMKAALDAALYEAGNMDDSWYTIEVAAPDPGEDPEEPTPGEPETPSPDADFDFEAGTILKYKGSAAELEVPAQIGGVPVTAIGAQAFAQNFGLKQITLPEGVISIGANAFENCRNLVALTLPSTLKEIGEWAFYQCIQLKTLALNDGLAKIGSHAFQYCHALTDMRIPASAADIGELAFTMCRGMTGFHVDAANPNYSDIDGVLFNKGGTELIRYPAGRTDAVYNIPDGTAAIAAEAFKLYYADSAGNALERVVFPSSLKKVGNNAFMQTNLKSVTIPANVNMGKYAFNLIPDLQTITVEEGVTELPEGVLYGLDNFKGELVLPSTLKTIGYRALDRIGVSNLVLPEGLETIESEAFECCKLETLVIPSTVKRIGDRAFYLCKSLKSVSFAGDSAIEDMGKYTFNHCRALTSVELPAGLRVLDDGCFSYCSSLETIAVPEGVAELKDVVFAGSGLVRCRLPESVVRMGTGTFRDCMQLTHGDLPAKLEALGACTFENCQIMERISIPETVRITTVPYDMFFNCRALKLVELPAVIASTEACAFSNCIADGFTVRSQREEKDFRRNLFDCYAIDPGDAYYLESGDYYIDTARYAVSKGYTDAERAFKKVTDDSEPVDSSSGATPSSSGASAGFKSRPAAGQSALCACWGGGSSLLRPTARPVFIYRKSSHVSNLAGDTTTATTVVPEQPSAPTLSPTNSQPAPRPSGVHPGQGNANLNVNPTRANQNQPADGSGTAAGGGNRVPRTGVSESMLYLQLALLLVLLIIVSLGILWLRRRNER